MSTCQTLVDRFVRWPVWPEPVCILRIELMGARTQQLHEFLIRKP